MYGHSYTSWTTRGGLLCTDSVICSLYPSRIIMQLSSEHTPSLSPFTLTVNAFYIQLQNRPPVPLNVDIEAIMKPKQIGAIEIIALSPLSCSKWILGGKSNLYNRFTVTFESYQ